MTWRSADAVLEQDRESQPTGYRDEAEMAKVRRRSEIEMARKVAATRRFVDPANVEARKAHILELWEMGCTRREIAETVGVTAQRVSQVVRSFGEVTPRPTSS